MVISDWLKRSFRVRKKVQFCSQTAEIKNENVDQYEVYKKMTKYGHEMYTWQRTDTAGKPLPARSSNHDD